MSIDPGLIILFFLVLAGCCFIGAAIDQAHQLRQRDLEHEKIRRLQLR